MWILLLIAIHISDFKDIPARVQIPFENQAACEYAKANMSYWIKFESFKIEATCQPKKS
jgi:hypothetical protein